MGLLRTYTAAVFAFFAGAAEAAADGGPLEDEIVALLEAYEAAKEARAYETLDGFWDVADAAPFYLAEEMAAPATEWSVIRDYWGGTKDASGWIDVEYDLIETKRIAAGEALAFINLRWDMTFEGFERPIGGSNRVLAGLRETDDGWRFHTWVEAPLAPYFYVRELYQLNVRPEVLEAKDLPPPRPTGAQR